MKRIFALVLTGLLCVSLASCYQVSDDPMPEGKPLEAAQEAPAALQAGVPETPEQEAASPQAPKEAEVAATEPVVPQAEEGEIVVDVQIEKMYHPERLSEAQAAQKQQTTIGEIVNQDIQSVTLKTKIGNGAIGSWGEYTSQPVGIDKWEAFVQTVDQETWGYHYCPGGNGLLTSPWNNEYVVIVTDADGREYAVHFWGSNWITTLAVPEGRTYDEFREENLRSNEAPMLFAHYTVDFDFYDQLLEIFTK